MENKITRGTTPNIQLVVNADLTDYTCVLSFGRYKRPVLTLDNENMLLEVTDEGVSRLTFYLTQEHTLSLPKGQTNIQLRCVKDDSAFATDLIPLEVLDVIDERRLRDEFDTPRD